VHKLIDQFKKKNGALSFLEGDENKVGKICNLIVASVFSMLQIYIAYLLPWQPRMWLHIFTYIFFAMSNIFGSKQWCKEDKISYVLM
jgi:hypothetical protein